jgi:hypothetical protein
MTVIFDAFIKMAVNTTVGDITLEGNQGTL